MAHRNRKKLSVLMNIAGLLGVLGILAGGFYLFIYIPMSAPASPPNPPSSKNYSASEGEKPPIGGISSTLTTPDGVALTLLEIKRQGTKLYFHFQAQNKSQKSQVLLGKTGNYQFYYTKAGKFTLVSMMPQKDVQSYPSFPAQIAADSTTEGWVMFDGAEPGIYSKELLYRFDAVETTTCKDPKDTSTCHPDLGFKALIWQF